MKPEFVYNAILPVTIELLPSKMTSEQAMAMLLAIGLQESNLEHRIQLIGGADAWWHSRSGPARGLWQFEVAGVTGVLTHAATMEPFCNVLDALQYPKDRPHLIHNALAHNDILAAATARLLLWTVPERLPNRDEPEKAWDQYEWSWRPGRPRPEHWREAWESAWAVIDD